MKFLDSKQSSNSFYMVLERLLLTTLNFIVFTTIARHLGVESIGLFSLTQAILLVGWPIALFVNEQIVIRSTLDEGINSNSVFKHSIILKILFTIVTYTISIATAHYFFGHNVAIYTSIFCLIHFCNFDIIFFAYFRAHRNSKAVFFTKITVAFPFAILKFFVILVYNDLLLLLTAYVLEALTLGISAAVLYLKTVDNRFFLKENLKFDHFSKLAKPSIPLLFSAVVIMLYSRVDQFMINNILGSSELGQYSVGVKISESSAILFGAYLASQFPKMLKLRADGNSLFDAHIIRLLQISLGFGTTVLVGAFFLANPAVKLLFGAEYSASSNVLIVHLFGAIFIYYGIICTQWLVLENLEYYRLVRVLLGLFLNIVLNLMWIEKYGIIGAAWATVISQISSNLIFNAFTKKNNAIFSVRT